MASVGLFGRHFGFTRLNPGIKVLRHAVSLDERRVKFQPNLCKNNMAPKDDQDGGGVSGGTSESLADSRAATPGRATVQKDAGPGTGRHNPNFASPMASGVQAAAKRCLGALYSSVKALARMRKGDQNAERATIDVTTEDSSSNSSEKPEPQNNPPEAVPLGNSHKEVWFAGCHSGRSNDRRLC